MRPSFIYICSVSIKHYVRAYLAAVLYLSMTLIGLVFLQLVTQGSIPSGLPSILNVFGDILLFYAPIVLSVGVLWAVLWVAYQWRKAEIPLLMELNGQPRRRLLWALQPFLIFNCLVVLFLLHQFSPEAGGRLHAQAQQTVVSQIPTSSIQKWGEIVLGSEERDETGLKNVFMATNAISVFSQSGFQGKNGELVLNTGVIRDIRVKGMWDLKFARARIQHVKNGLEWSVHMLPSNRLQEKIIKAPEPKPLRRELYKRTVQSIVLWLMGMSALVLTLRGWAIGITLIGAILSWWLGMRFFDHQVATIGPVGSALGPLGIQTLIFCATLVKWRGK